MRETEVRLDGWCEGGLRQQRNKGGGCATIRERSGRVEIPGTYITESASRCHFCLALFFRTALPCSGSYHLERGGINCKKSATIENQGSDVKCMDYGVYLVNCVSDLT